MSGELLTVLSVGQYLKQALVSESTLASYRSVVVPIQFAYANSRGKDIAETVVDLLQTIVPEKNSVIEKFATFGVQARDAFETQSLLQMKQSYCNEGQCMRCAVGLQLLKN